ncbi:MAG TPA: hypothetical protein VK540_05945 [Polyangiaceae bacterium]|jgi:hypothetical protein|nr:hypothetical protein [Polyangiaceae bacterium]
MSGRRSQSAFRLVVVCAALVAASLGARTARAEDMIIKRPGDHPVYSVEIEPHLTLAFLIPSAGSSGVGIGGRFTIPIVKNGFVSSINNSVGIGFGLDWIHYNGCYRRWGNPYSCPNFETFILPVVMQWNFFLSTHWSVFGEPGLAINFNGYGSCVDFYYNDRGERQGYVCGDRPNRLGVDPFILFVGGRYHFSETTALTMRIGWPYASIGVSFMP